MEFLEILYEMLACFEASVDVLLGLVYRQLGSVCHFPEYNTLQIRQCMKNVACCDCYLAVPAHMFQTVVDSNPGDGVTSNPPIASSFEDCDYEIW